MFSRFFLLTIACGLVATANSAAFAQVGGSAAPGPFVPGARTYKAWQGQIDVALFEMAISSRFNNTPVLVTNIRWPRNPGSYLMHVISRFHENGPTGFYVVTADIGENKGERFDLILVEQRQTAVLLKYERGAILRDYDPIATFSYREIGLSGPPPFGSPGNQ